MRICILVCVFFSISVLGSNSSDPENFRRGIKTLTVKNGLSQNGVMSIYKDSNGFMWFGTRDGLNRYDGQSFKIYRNKIDDSFTISDNTITSIIEDDKGVLWVGTENGLNHFDPITSKVKKRYFISNGNKLYDGNHINDLFIDFHGNLWVGTMAGLFVKESSQSDFRKVDIVLSTASLDLSINTICEDNLGNLWLGSLNNGLIKFNPSTSKFLFFKGSKIDTDIFLNNHITTLTSGDNNIVWAGTLDGFLVRIDSRNNLFQRIAYGNDFNNVSNHSIRKIIFEDQENMWIGTFDGLVQFNISTKKSVIYKYNDKLNNSISQNSIRSLWLDDIGKLWVGTYFGGVNILEENVFQFEHYKHNAFLSNSLSSDIVGPIKEDWNGNLWIGTEGGGVNVFDYSTRSFTQHAYSLKESPSIGNNTVKAIEIDKLNKRVWIGTRLDGVVLSNPITGVRKEFINKQEGQGLSSNKITALHLDKNGQLWVGTRNGLNIISITGTGDFVVKRYMNISSSDKCLTYDEITSIFQDEHSNLWVGTKLSGLILLNENQSKAVRICDQYGLNLAQENYIKCIFQDSNGRILFGTYGAGLYIIEDETIKNFRFEDGLPNNIVYGILEDDDGFLWISSSGGLSRLDLNSDTFINYTPKNGFPIYELSENSAFKTSRGQIVSGGINGFVLFEPINIHNQFDVPNIVLTGFKLSNQEIEHGDEHDVLFKKGKEIARAVFNQKQNVFSIEYASLNYPQFFKNSYAYMLEGFDENWNYVEGQNSATYTNLDPGTYKFKVKTASINGTWSDSVTLLEVEKKPPFWKSLWAYALYLILLTSVFFVVRKYSLIKIQLENNLNLERLEKKNIEDLSRLKVRFFTNISHDFRTPLTLINGPLQQISRQLKQKELMPLVNIVERNVLLMLRLVNQLMDFRKLESNNFPLKVEEGNLILYLKEISSTFKEYAISKNVKFTFSSEVSSDELYWFDRDKIEKVIYNLLSNAFKFTEEEGVVKIDIQKVELEEKNNDYLKISINNSGYGINKDELDKIFLPFYQSDNLDTKSLYGAGIGLSLVKDLVEIHKGFIEVESIKDVSAQFDVYLPTEDVYEENQKRRTNGNSKKIAKLDLTLNSFSKKKKIATKVTKSKEKHSVLLVEDNDDLRKYICQSMTEEFLFLETSNGKDAINLLENAEILPDIIISDVMMPEVSGLELCEYVKKNAKTAHIPIILLTARTDLYIEKYSYSMEIEDYITKPFDMDILKLKLANIISRISNHKNRLRKDIFLDKKEKETSSNDEELLHRFSEYIRTHIASPELSVEQIGKEMGLSRVQLFRRIKKITGGPPTEFIRNFKLNVAAELLTENKYNINEVCYKSGFHDVSYFRKCFKTKYGVTAGDYRKSKNNISIN